MSNQPINNRVYPHYSLARIFADLRGDARATGGDARRTLKGGAIVAVRERDGVITVNLQRHGTPVGAVELNTFRKHANIPDDAERIPAEGQGQRGDLYYVAYRWRE